jgi:hypothetical protein
MLARGPKEDSDIGSNYTTVVFAVAAANTRSYHFPGSITSIFGDSLSLFCADARVHLKHYNFFYFVLWNFGYGGHYWPIVPAPDDR